MNIAVFASHGDSDLMHDIQINTDRTFGQLHAAGYRA